MLVDRLVFQMFEPRQGRASIYQSSMKPQEHSSVLIALDWINCPAILLDRNGSVLAVSGKAPDAFDSEFSVRGRRIYVADYQSRTRLEELLDRARLLSGRQPPPVSRLVINRVSRRPIVIEAIPRRSGSGSLPCDVGLLLLLTDLDEAPVISRASLMEVFGLTPAQAQVASLLVKGKSLEDIAREMNISSGTARNHLKAVFARTATRRQGELVSLLSRLQ
ncbi:helix-turn-helix transcriptional regulator [Bradyrhizobium erythrophlei]|uniref:helix-turn-helix transcriptional regulator n=1 Tax=Bradyrhizobium erythrophlei TaxID=1437360 RepID=UPI0035EB4014